MSNIHRLARLAYKEEQRILQLQIPDLAEASECLRGHMQPEDWLALEKINREHQAPDSIAHFLILRNWLVESRYLVGWGDTENPMTTDELRTTANKIQRDLKKLSREITATFPELATPMSIHRLMSVNTWTRHLDWTNPSDLELWEISGQVESGLRSLSQNGLTPSVAGRDSFLEKLESYIAEHSHHLRAPPARRKYPLWCRYATRRLANTIRRSPFFKPAKKSFVFRIIEFSIMAVADFQKLETPEDWGPDQIEDALKSL
ncbi:hypothetical protein [Wenzhouxiangella limi]|uniref:Uncharacterized protein n=1 Tax=Wenzhouxiangella limi TaxID=2707351 RepID=A0A845VCP7_9GAMM|nr:hypothetical protein [Wenzhouxiangella limi]NDY95049.1 hypothetical protein [Wenzhouxiangella limi]